MAPQFPNQGARSALRANHSLSRQRPDIRRLFGFRAGSSRHRQRLRRRQGGFAPEPAQSKARRASRRKFRVRRERRHAFRLAAGATSSRFCAAPHAYRPADRRHRENDQHDALAGPPSGFLPRRTRLVSWAHRARPNCRAGRETRRFLDPRRAFPVGRFAVARSRRRGTPHCRRERARRPRLEFDAMTRTAEPELQSFALLRRGARRFAVTANQIAELVAPSRIFRFPHHTSEVEGVILRRGRIVPVCDVAETLIGKRSEEHTSELQSPDHLVCRLLLEKKKKNLNAYCSSNIIYLVLLHIVPQKP